MPCVAIEGAPHKIKSPQNLPSQELDCLNTAEMNWSSMPTKLSWKYPVQQISPRNHDKKIPIKYQQTLIQPTIWPLNSAVQVEPSNSQAHETNLWQMSNKSVCTAELISLFQKCSPLTAPYQPNIRSRLDRCCNENHLFVLEQYLQWITSFFLSFDIGAAGLNSARPWLWATDRVHFLLPYSNSTHIQYVGLCGCFPYPK